MALKWHPDKNNESEEAKTHAEKMFRDVSEAYTILSDPNKRKQHDMGVSGEDIESGMGGMGGMGGFPGGMQFNMGGGGRGGIDPNEIFKMFFSGMGGPGMSSEGTGMGGFPGGGF